MVAVALVCHLIHLPAKSRTWVPITTMAQPQTYSNSTTLSVACAALSAPKPRLWQCPGTLTHTKQPLAPSFATPNPTPASPAQPPVTYGHSERAAGPACAVLGRDVLSSAGTRGCDAGREGKYCAQLTIANVFYARVGAVSSGTMWTPLRASRPVLAVAAFVWGEQVFFLLLML